MSGRSFHLKHFSGDLNQVTGIKTYDQKADDAVLEMNLEWGSDMHVKIGVRIKLGPLVIYIPLWVEDVQVRASRQCFLPCSTISSCAFARSCALFLFLSL